MKRKNSSPPPETREDPETKYDLKRVKTNEFEDLILDNTKDDKLYAINLPKRNPGESSIDRFLGSLRKENNQPNIENDQEKTMIVKDLTNTYRLLDDYTKMSPKPSRANGFSELRQVRTLAKLNKIDENQQNEDQEFNEKISKKLESMLTSVPIKEPSVERKFESKKTESLKKALELVKFSKNKEISASSDQMESEDLGSNPNNHKQFSELTPIKNSAERISPESYRTNTADQTPNSDRKNTEMTPETPSATKKKVVIPPIKYLQAPKTSNTAKKSTPVLQSSSHKSPTSHLLVSAGNLNKRRQSFSINDVSSKSKAFHNYSSVKPSAAAAATESIPAKSRRASTVPKPATSNTKRKSFYVPGDNSELGKNTPQTSRKSLTPESHMVFEDISRENNLLKKDLERKNKEIESLKREKLALLRKFKTNDSTENQEKITIEGKLKVYCRVRPSYKGDATPILTFPELDWMKQNGDNTQKFGIKCVEINNTLNKKTPFYFDRVFPPQATQAEIFEEFVPVIDRVINGENMCVISYGQPASGKSYTLFGAYDSQTVNMELLGIVPRIVDVLLVKAGAAKFGGKCLQIQVGCLVVSEGKMADLSVDPEIFEGDIEWMPMNSEGKEAEGINERVIWNPIGSVRELLDLLEKTEGMMKNRKYTFNTETQVYLVKVTDEEERESTISFMEVLQWGSEARNQAKGKNPALMAFVNQIQRLFVNNKETFLMFNLSSDEEDYMQAKEALEISQQFGNVN